MKLLIALVVWIAAIAGAAELASTVAAKYKSTGSSAAAATASFDPSSVKAADRLSLFRTGNLAKALNVARAHIGRNPQIQDATIYPGYLVLGVLRAGSASEVEIEADGTYAGSTPGGSSGLGHFPLAQLSPSAPTWLARRIAASAHVAKSALRYMILSVNPISGLAWQIYPVQTGTVEYFAAAGNGRQLVAWTAGGPRPLR